jgi:glycerol kinase
MSSSSGLITTIAYQIGSHGTVKYALEGSIAYCGSMIQWLRDNLEIVKSIPDSERLATSVPDNGGVYFVPAFSGLFSPYWRDDARGVIVGLTAYNTKAHVVRAAIEAMSFQTKDIFEAMHDDTGTSLSTVRVNGGVTKVKQFTVSLFMISWYSHVEHICHAIFE